MCPYSVPEGASVRHRDIDVEKGNTLSWLEVDVPVLNRTKRVVILGDITALMAKQRFWIGDCGEQRMCVGNSA